MSIFRLIVMIVFSIAIVLDALALTLFAIFPTKNYKLSKEFSDFLIFFTTLLFPIIMLLLNILLWVS